MKHCLIHVKTLYDRHTLQKDGTTMCFWNLVTMGPRRQWQRFCETKRRRRGSTGSGGDELALHLHQVKKENQLQFFFFHIALPRCIKYCFGRFYWMIFMITYYTRNLYFRKNFVVFFFNHYVERNRLNFISMTSCFLNFCSYILYRVS